MIIGIYQAILENLSTVTRMLLCPMDVGKSPTISILMMSQGILGISFRYKWFVFFSLSGLFTWHFSQPFTYRLISSINLGHQCHDLAKWLSYYLYFFSFPFLLSWTYYTEGSAGKCHITSVTQSHHMMSHDRSHDRHGKEVHRPCSSSVENLMGTLLSSSCQMLIKEQLA